MFASIQERKLFVQELIRKVIAKESNATRYFDLPETTKNLLHELTQVLNGIYGGFGTVRFNPAFSYVFPKFMNGDLILLSYVIPWEGETKEGFFLFFWPERVTTAGECKSITSSYQHDELLEELQTAISTTNQGKLLSSVIDRCGTVEDMVKIIEKENHDA